MKRKCLILKESEGGLCGYLMQEGERITCKRREGFLNGGTLVCIDRWGVERRMPLDDETAQMQWMEDMELLEMAYGVMDGRLLFASGEEARRRYEADISEGHDGAERAADTEKKELQLREGTAAESAHQEARWPPPPCMPGARYRSGAWRAQ